MIVAELERALLARYPKTNAEGWDHVGLSVGDPAAKITGVACALDATEANVRRALEAGANVLLTHHPIYIKAPEAFCPADSARPQCSAALYEMCIRDSSSRGRAPRWAMPRWPSLEGKTE